MKRFIGIFTVVLFLCALSDCGAPEYESVADFLNDGRPSVTVDLEEIKQKGKLTVITGFNPLSYFIYKGNPMGYDYELLHQFANEIGVELELYVVKDFDSVYHYLNSGKGDIIAFGLTVTKDGRRKAAFTHPHMEVHQVLVQRKPDTWRTLNYDQVMDSLITHAYQLAGKTVHVRGSSPHMDRMFDLIEETGSVIDLVPVKGEVSSDELIRMVAEGEIDYTVADENVALLGSTYFPNLDVRTAVSQPHGLVWAVRKNAPNLLGALNDWLDKMRKTEDYNLIYKKYFKGKKQIAKWASSDFFSQSSNGDARLSEYDELIRRYARRIGWDWRLLASLIYEESHFNPESCSWAGAEGLMQLMPATGYRFGAAELSNPEQNIYAGTRYLRWLEKFWDDIPKEERIYFILASYNVGEAHVRDAMRLAEKNGADKYRWTGNVEEYLRRKSKPEYYNDSVCKSGYCRGEVTVNYVREVMERYRHYAQHIPAEDTLLEASAR